MEYYDCCFQLIYDDGEDDDHNVIICKSK